MTIQCTITDPIYREI